MASTTTMRIDSIRLTNFQSFADSGEITLEDLTLFVGRNNSGKSAILNAIRQHQEGLGMSGRDLVRVGATEAAVLTRVSDIPESARLEAGITTGGLDLRVGRSGGFQLFIRVPSAESGGAGRPLFPGLLPGAIVVPLLAERSVRQFDETINTQTASTVRTDTSNVAALISSLVNAGDPRGASFSEASTRLFGFNMGLTPSQNGQVPGLIVDDANTIPISAMGTGVVSMLRILAYLVRVQDKIILIEEPENDLHPEALKYVLKLIAEVSRQNQVLVTTHSHIVVNVLGGVKDSRVYRVDMNLEARIPTASVTPCDSAEDRLALLRQLGYELTDFGLHEGFLILEEASAESVITRLMGWFAPRLLGRLRTIAAYGVNDVEPRLSDLKRLFVFVHLEDVYKDRAWVLVDGDDAGRSVVDGLKANFESWDASHFMTLEAPDFEAYYPPRFAEKAAEALAEPDINRRRQRKNELIVEVLKWAGNNEPEAKTEFEKSAAYVIGVLRQIEDQLAM